MKQLDDFDKMLIIEKHFKTLTDTQQKNMILILQRLTDGSKR